MSIADNSIRRETGWADARLIAAAPDLLDAAIKLDHMALVIESAVRNANNGNYNKVLFALKAVAAAIAKTEGAPRVPHSECGND